MLIERRSLTPEPAARGRLSRLHRAGRRARLAVSELDLGDPRLVRQADRAAWGCAAAGATRTSCAWARRWISGGSRRSKPDRLLRLRAEMKVPGRAWLEFQSLPQPDGGTLLTQTAYFAPRGVAGSLILVCALPDPRLHLQRHDPQDRRTGEGTCRVAGRHGYDAWHAHNLSWSPVQPVMWAGI